MSGQRDSVWHSLNEMSRWSLEPIAASVESPARPIKPASTTGIAGKNSRPIADQILSDSSDTYDGNAFRGTRRHGSHIRVGSVEEADGKGI